MASISTGAARAGALGSEREPLVVDFAARVLRSPLGGGSQSRSPTPEWLVHQQCPVRPTHRFKRNHGQLWIGDQSFLNCKLSSLLHMLPHASRMSSIATRHDPLQWIKQRKPIFLRSSTSSRSVQWLQGSGCAMEHPRPRLARTTWLSRLSGWRPRGQP